MHAKNFFASAHVGTVHHYAAVKAPGAEQRGVENIGPVGRGHQDHAFVGFKPIHLDQ